MKMSQIANPKNTWFLLYEKSILDQFLGLLIELNSAEKALSYRYEILKKNDPEVQSLFKSKHQDMENFSRNGIGTALILGTDSLFKEIQSFSGNNQKMDISPKIKNIYWSDAIRAAGNHIGHSDEWSDEFKKYCTSKGIPEFSLEKRPDVESSFDLLPLTRSRI